jgi:peptidyl-tRNA hydrolase
MLYKGYYSAWDEKTRYVTNRPVTINYTDEVDLAQKLAELLRLKHLGPNYGHDGIRSCITANPKQD